MTSLRWLLPKPITARALARPAGAYNCIRRIPERLEAAGFSYRDHTHFDERADMNTLPVDRALSIYGALADRSETKGAREQLSRHLMKLYIGGEKDQHRLTVHGLSYLRDLDRALDSRN